MTPTPRTDAVKEHVSNAYNDWVLSTDYTKEIARYVVCAEKCEELECELNEANQQLSKLREIARELAQALSMSHDYVQSLDAPDSIHRSDLALTKARAAKIIE